MNPSLFPALPTRPAHTFAASAPAEPDGQGWAQPALFEPSGTHGTSPGPAEDDMHLVSAHSRLLSDGTSVFVQEHLRFNPPKGRGRRTATPRSSAAPADQLGLFGRR